jgi:hypothetical protein
VVRTWAFCDGSRAGALQPRAGVFDESVFRALDRVVAQAQARNVRLLLVLTNYWQDYGACKPAGVNASHAFCAGASLTHTQRAARRRHRGVRVLGKGVRRARVEQRRRAEQRLASASVRSLLTPRPH